MKTYFKPLRRKLGVMTLGLACVFAAWWVTSLSSYDHIEAGRYALMSSEGRITLSKRVVTYEGARPSVAFQYVSIRYRPIVISLTLLSAWLLLSKPRIRKIEQRIPDATPDSLRE